MVPLYGSRHYHISVGVPTSGPVHLGVLRCPRGCRGAAHRGGHGSRQGLKAVGSN